MTANPTHDPSDDGCLQVALVTPDDRQPLEAPICTACACTIDTDRDCYYLMYVATPDGPVDYTTAHVPIQDDDGEREDTACFERFDQLWHQHLRAVGADTLRLELELGGYRWYLGDEALHAGTPIDLLAADGTWIPGRFEYDNRPEGSTTIFYLTLGGWDRPQAALSLPSRAVLRLSDR